LLLQQLLLVLSNSSERTIINDLHLDNNTRIRQIPENSSDPIAPLTRYRAETTRLRAPS
jgi:hypothetical protein